MTIKHFKGITTHQELKAAYKALAKKFHPDINPDGERTMMEINAEYDYLCDHMQPGTTATGAPDRATTSEAMRAYRDIIAQLITMDGLDIELCGAWLWIGGATYLYKERIKEIGCFWASKKRMWYWRPIELTSSSRKTYDMGYIRAKYGSILIEGNPAQHITA